MATSAAVNQVRDRILREEEFERDELGALYVPRKIINSWRLIPTAGLPPKSKKIAHRLNSLGNLFYFAVNVLRKSKFQMNPDLRLNLHYQMCMVVMKDGLKEVIEIPRDHFKSTVYSECFPIWRALPFTNEDEDIIYSLGYPPIYVEWMRRAHNQNIRILLVSEVATNAIKLGKRIGNHYNNGEFFKELFPEILPDGSCVWNNTSLTHKRSKASAGDGEGTYDFIGVGGALQSTHYDMAIEDDLVGRDAIKSETVLEGTIEYHKLIAGAINADNTNAGRDFDEIVVGNRWSFKDLNSYIRKEEPYFNFITHSALGGCCPLHVHGIPIFPEQFNLEKLARLRKRFGTYFFSCQWLNYPINPEQCKFELSNIRYFHYEADNSTLGSPLVDIKTKEIKKKIRIKIRHHVAEGDVEEDIFPRNLTRYMVVDPNHSGAKGRCRHAITVTGVRDDIRRVYLLKAWAKSCGVQEFVIEIFRTAIAFKLTTIYLEVVGAQKFLKFHLEYFILVNKHNPEWEGIQYITISDLKSANTENAKSDRIDSFVPITERKEFWINTKDAGAGGELAIQEMETYGNRGSMIDVLDTLGYGPQVWKFQEQDEEELAALLKVRQQRFTRAMATA